MRHKNQDERKQKCYECSAFSKCLSDAIDNGSVRCVDFDKLKVQVDEAMDKLDSVCASYPFSEEEIKNLIFFSSTHNLE